jgi:glycosyltransferase involved in cell wall biosynthesis
VIEGQGARRQALLADQLSRNFGHQIAITVGLDHAAGRAVIVIDADLQDPPEVVLEMIAKWKEGYDVVSAERASRQGESRFKRATANLFYRRMGRVGDVSTPRPAISAWSIARRSDGRATASGDIELAGGDRSRRWPGGFERIGAGGNPFTRDLIATAHVLRFTLARRARTGR